MTRAGGSGRIVISQSTSPRGPWLLWLPLGSEFQSSQATKMVEGGAELEIEVEMEMTWHENAGTIL